ncbi:MAG: tetratricopeptide repeat protein, partial [Gammaproteobacteria bacterium]|nr:tetratricopeptide repeat protein [Gammaproteobacteria bacterium]
LSMAIELHKHGQLEEARSVYNDVLRAAPEHPDALHYLGVTLHQLGNSDEGIAHIKQSLELSADNPDAVNNLGNIYRETGRLEDAEEAYRTVLEFAPKHVDTLVNLSIILRKNDKTNEALDLLEQALDIDPNHATAYHNLGNVYRALKKSDEALVAFSKAQELAPHDDMSYLSIASTLYDAKKYHEAMDVLRQLLDRFPDHPIGSHMLAAYSGENIPKRAPDRYVRQLFDDFSTHFDESLARLDYQAPRLVGSRVIDQFGAAGRGFRVLDIGCGTGLCGALVKPVARTLIGVDLSPKMLQKATKKAVYDHLEVAELTEYMNAAPDQFDIVICVDTFVYFGDLSEAFNAASRTLSANGWLFFTVETHTDKENQKGYCLQHHGRYGHSREYLGDTLESAGFAVQSLEDVVLREEGGQPVAGTLAVARKL